MLLPTRPDAFAPITKCNRDAEPSACPAESTRVPPCFCLRRSREAYRPLSTFIFVACFGTDQTTLSQVILVWGFGQFLQPAVVRVGSIADVGSGRKTTSSPVTSAACEWWKRCRPLAFTVPTAIPATQPSCSDVFQNCVEIAFLFWDCQ